MDDVYFPEMANKNIYYINIKPYIYELLFEEMYKRFLNSEIGKKIIEKIENDDSSYEDKENKFIEFMSKNIKMYNFQVVEKNGKEYEIDKILGKKIMVHLEEFFKKSNKNKTRKNIPRKKNKSSKN